jgi:CBS domain containing-hemolysin-like protein
VTFEDVIERILKMDIVDEADAQIKAIKMVSDAPTSGAPKLLRKYTAP